MPRTFVLVGSGIAALAAAEAIRERDDRAVLHLIGEEPHEFYSRPGLAYLLRGDIPERQLTVRTRDEVRRLRLDRIHARVARLHPELHEVVLEDGRTVAYDRVLLATGATAVPPPFYQGDLGGLVKLDSLDDARRILKLAGRGKTAVVVGGGITALEIVEGLRARGTTVHYFLRAARYWADVLDEDESDLILGRLRHEGVILHPNTQVESLATARGRLTGVTTQGGRTLACQILAVAIGVRPRLELARGADLGIDRGVLVNACMQTSAADVYAAGDVAQVYDPATGPQPMDVLWGTALNQGRVAGANMAGERVLYTRGLAFNVTQLAGLQVTLLGNVGRGKDSDLVTIARGDSQSWRQDVGAGVATDGSGTDRVRIMIGERTLVGALVMGDQTWSRPLQRLIAARADVSAIRPVLAAGGAAALDRLALFYQRWAQGPGGTC